MRRTGRTQLNLIALLLLFVSLTAFTHPTTQPTTRYPTDNNWTFMIAPYGWIFGMNGTVAVKNRSVKIDLTPMDIIEDVLPNIDFIGQIHLEASKGNWSYMFDPTYLKLSVDASSGPLKATVKTELSIIDFGVFHTVTKRSLTPHLNHPVFWQVFAGGRYSRIKLGLTPLRLPTIGGAEDFVTPIIGGRLLAQLSDKIHFVLRADYGGFGVNDVKRTWSAFAAADYAFNKNISLALGIRAVDINYTTGSGANFFKFDTKFYGPVLGLIFIF